MDCPRRVLRQTQSQAEANARGSRLRYQRNCRCGRSLVPSRILIRESRSKRKNQSFPTEKQRKTFRNFVLRLQQSCSNLRRLRLRATRSNTSSEERLRGVFSDEVLPQLQMCCLRASGLFSVNPVRLLPLGPQATADEERGRGRLPARRECC